MEPPHKYLLIQRCKPYGVWPKNFLYQDDHRVLEIVAQGETYKLTLRLGVKTYDDTMFANGTDSERPRVGRMVIDDRHRSGFWVGNMALHAPDEKTNMIVNFRNVEPGEIDFFVGVGCSKEVPMDALERALPPLIVTFMVSLATRLGDIIVTTAPPQLSKVMDCSQSKMESRFNVYVRNRPTLAPETIEATFPAFFDIVTKMSAENSRRVAVAMRRYQSSMSETDPVDRFCDLWETCEFLAECAKSAHRDAGRKIGGHIDFTIAFVVASNMGRNRNDVHAKAIKKLYDIRGDLVHNAVEDPEGILGMVHVMEDVAVQMIRYTFSMGQGSAPHLEKMLAT
jgi:hypothetical protein